MVSASTASPTKRLEDLDLSKQEIPTLEWAAFLPDGWKIETTPAMDEVMWRWFLERWRREVIDKPPDDLVDEPADDPAAPSKP